MFYILEVKDHVRVEPELFDMPVKESIAKQLEKKYREHIDREFGAIITVLDVSDVGEGILIPGDAAAYYESTFKLLVFRPELQELVYGQISQITNFGAFIEMGAIEGMLHISQTMEDFVSFSKTNSLIGKNTKRSVKKGDLCLARIVAVSFKTIPPKIGLTMRQPGLGKLDWISEDKKKAKHMADKMARVEAKEAKGKAKPKEKK